MFDFIIHDILCRVNAFQEEANMKFHERLKLLRVQSAFMQKDIARILGVSVRTFQGWETGRSEPNFEKLIAIADLFEVDLDWLLGRDRGNRSS